jgi:MFS family permease
MFIIINYTTLPLVNQIFQKDDVFIYFELISSILAGVLAVSFGFFADQIGRKRLVVSGFALLGLGYAILGLFEENVFGWYFYTVVDGIAWGAFYAIFFTTIWGDLAQGRSSEKHYALGFLPFLFSVLLQSTGNYLVGADLVLTSAVFSFASFFLFIAVLPLAYAPETLNIKDREFKSYVQKAINTKLQSDLDR